MFLQYRSAVAPYIKHERNAIQLIIWQTVLSSAFWFSWENKRRTSSRWIKDNCCSKMKTALYFHSPGLRKFSFPDAPKGSSYRVVLLRRLKWKCCLSARGWGVFLSRYVTESHPMRRNYSSASQRRKQQRQFERGTRREIRGLVF